MASSVVAAEGWALCCPSDVARVADIEGVGSAKDIVVGKLIPIAITNAAMRASVFKILVSIGQVFPVVVSSTSISETQV